MSENQENAGAFDVNSMVPRSLFTEKRPLNEAAKIVGLHCDITRDLGREAQLLSSPEKVDGGMVTPRNSEQKNKDEPDNDVAPASLKIVVRMRPTGDEFKSFTVEENKFIVATNPKKSAQLHWTTRPRIQFDRVFNADATQANVYSDLGVALVDQLLRGQKDDGAIVISSHIGTCDSSFSIIGNTTAATTTANEDNAIQVVGEQHAAAAARGAEPTVELHDDAGLLPRMIQQSLAELQSMPSTTRNSLSISCVELLNDKGDVRCLLTPNTATAVVASHPCRGRSAFSFGVIDEERPVSRSSSQSSRTSMNSRNQQLAGGQSVASPHRWSAAGASKRAKQQGNISSRGSNDAWTMLDDPSQEAEVDEEETNNNELKQRNGNASSKRDDGYLRVRLFSMQDAMEAFRGAQANRLPKTIYEEETRVSVLRSMVVKLCLHAPSDRVDAGVEPSTMETGMEVVSQVTIVDMPVQIPEDKNNINKQIDKKKRNGNTKSQAAKTNLALHSSLSEVVRCLVVDSATSALPSNSGQMKLKTATAGATSPFLEPSLSQVLRPLFFRASSSSSSQDHNHTQSSSRLGSSDSGVLMLVSLNPGNSDFVAKETLLTTIHTLHDVEGHHKSACHSSNVLRHSAPAAVTVSTNGCSSSSSSSSSKRENIRLMRKRAQNEPAVFGKDALLMLGFVKLSAMFPTGRNNRGRHRLRTAFSRLQFNTYSAAAAVPDDGDDDDAVTDDVVDDGASDAGAADDDGDDDCEEEVCRDAFTQTMPTMTSTTSVQTSVTSVVPVGLDWAAPLIVDQGHQVDREEDDCDEMPPPTTTTTTRTHSNAQTRSRRRISRRLSGLSSDASDIDAASTSAGKFRHRGRLSNGSHGSRVSMGASDDGGSVISVQDNESLVQEMEHLKQQYQNTVLAQDDRQPRRSRSSGEEDDDNDDVAWHQGLESRLVESEQRYGKVMTDIVKQATEIKRLKAIVRTHQEITARNAGLELHVAALGNHVTNMESTLEQSKLEAEALSNEHDRVTMELEDTQRQLAEATREADTATALAKKEVKNRLLQSMAARQHNSPRPRKTFSGGCIPQSTRCTKPEPDHDAVVVGCAPAAVAGGVDDIAATSATAAPTTTDTNTDAYDVTVEGSRQEFRVAEVGTGLRTALLEELVGFHATAKMTSLAKNEEGTLVVLGSATSAAFVQQQPSEGGVCCSIARRNDVLLLPLVFYDDEGSSGGGEGEIVKSSNRTRRSRSISRMDAETWESICCVPPLLKTGSVACHTCSAPFGHTLANFRCRSCGECFCVGCAPDLLRLPWYGYTEDPVRVCKSCRSIWAKGDVSDASDDPNMVPPILLTDDDEHQQTSYPMSTV